MAFNLDNIITHDFCNINKYINKLFLNLILNLILINKIKMIRVAALIIDTLSISIQTLI